MNSDQNIPVYNKSPIAINIDNYYYDPPSWKVCDRCNGSGMDEHTDIAIPDKPHPKCPNCNGTGHFPIYYTPEQWEEAGGILTDDTACWQIIKQGSQTLYFMEPWGDLKTLREGTIIISAIRPDELQNK